MRNPKVRDLTSLEEDFKNIGILEESDDSEGGKKGKRPEGETPREPRERDAHQDRDNRDHRDVPHPDDGDDEGLAEARIRRQFRGGKVINTKRSSAKKRRQARMWRRSSGGKKSARARKRTMRKPSMKRLMKRKMLRAKKRGTRHESFDQVNNLLEDVQNIVSALGDKPSKDTHLENAVKAFANVAIISEMLADFFSEGVELVEDKELSEELADAASFFAEQAERAAEIATKLDSGSLSEDIDVDTLFQEQMDSLVEGLEFYADMTEDDDEEDLEETKGKSQPDDEDEDSDEDSDE